MESRIKKTIKEYKEITSKLPVGIHYNVGEGISVALIPSDSYRPVTIQGLEGKVRVKEEEVLGLVRGLISICHSEEIAGKVGEYLEDPLQLK